MGGCVAVDSSAKQDTKQAGAPIAAKALGVFALAMINVAAVLSLRNYPSMAV